MTNKNLYVIQQLSKGEACRPILCNDCPMAHKNFKRLKVKGLLPICGTELSNATLQERCKKYLMKLSLSII